MELVLTAKKFGDNRKLSPTFTLKAGPLKGKTARAFDFDEVKLADAEKEPIPPEFSHTLYIADGEVDLEINRERHYEGANVVGTGGYKIHGRDARTFETGLLTVIEFTSQTDSRYAFLMNHGSGLVELWRV